MNASVKSCDQDVAASVLDEQIDGIELERLEAHLEACDLCQESLQNQTADEEAWRNVREYLADDADDLERISDSDSFVGDGSSLPDGYQTLIEGLAPTDDPHMLGRLGQFEVVGIIGAGGMGVVLKAFDPSLSRFVALKVLATELWNNETARARFAREARAAASVLHENIIEIYGVDSDGSVPFYAMPYLRGETLADRIRRCGPLPPDEVLRISKQIADGIGAAHQQGLVHRDLKPANIFLSQGTERVHVADFGLASVAGDEQLTQTGFLAGTPAFMSPEQINAEPLDARSDLFSLGSVMYTMCAGEPPFGRETAIQTLRQICDESPTRLEEINPGVPTWLAAIIDRLHQHSPDDRYQTAEELSTDLQACLAHEQNPESCIQPRSVLRLQNRYEKAIRSRKGISFAVCLLSIFSLLALAAWMLPNNSGAVVPVTVEKKVTVEGLVVDSRDKPLANTVVLAVRKTWTNGYRQSSLATRTDKNGKFTFDNFAPSGNKYAFLVTALPKNHSMTSIYKLVGDGSQHEPVSLKVMPSKPVKLRILDAKGKAVSGAKVLPSSRVTPDGERHMTYAMQVGDSETSTDAEGWVSLDAFQLTDNAKVYVDVAGDVTELAIDVSAGSAVARLDRVVDTDTPPVSINGTVIGPDEKGLAGVKIIVVRKTWPSGRFRMNAIEAKTDHNGNFQLKDFVPANLKYEFLITVIEDGFAMVSEYRGMDEKDQAAPVRLKLVKAEPITFVITDSDGNPLEGVELTPHSRPSGSAFSYLNYPINRAKNVYETDAKGQCTMTAWLPGEKGRLMFKHGDDSGQLDFQVPESGSVGIRLP